MVCVCSNTTNYEHIILYKNRQRERSKQPKRHIQPTKAPNGQQQNIIYEFSHYVWSCTLFLFRFQYPPILALTIFLSLFLFLFFRFWRTKIQVISRTESLRRLVHKFTIVRFQFHSIYGIGFTVEWQIIEIHAESQISTTEILKTISC